MTGGPVEGRPDTRSPVWTLLTAGWRPAIVRAGIAFLATIGLGVAVAALRFATEGGSLLRIPRAGALVFALFHRVPIEVELPLPGPGSLLGGFEVSVSITGALLGGTAVALWLLYRGGVVVAGEAGGSPQARALHGAKVAPPYALLAVAISLLASMPAGAAGLGGSEGASLQPSPIGAFLWPLLLAAGAGAAGGVASAGAAAFTGTLGGLRGPLAGGWRMLWGVVLLGTVGVLVVAGLHPRQTRAVLDAATRVANPGTAVASTVLFLPNAGTGAAEAAMGGGVDVETPALSCTVISYGRFPRGLSSEPLETGGLSRCDALPFELDTAPLGYLLFLLAPAAATVAGGWRAGGIEDARSLGAGALAGALGAPVFAAGMWGLAFLSRLSYRADLGGFGTEVTLGPDLGQAFFLALGWGLAGGAVGGALAARARARDEPGPVVRA